MQLLRGAPSILTYIVDSQRINKDGRQGFSYDMAYRVSAAMRNILCIPSNHLSMVQQGCIRALESIAAQSEKGKNASDPVTPHTQANCLAAFKSMTYNSEVRDALTSSGAIDVIVQELMQEDTAITYPLLVQVEAESWSNGARSTTRSGRAKQIEPYPPYTDLIETFKIKEEGESKNASLDEGDDSPRHKKSLRRTTSTLAMSFQSELVKRDVKVELEEPELEIEESKEALMYGVNDLQSISDPEDVSTPVTKLCPKMPVEAEVTSVNYLKSDHTEEYHTIESKDFFNPDILASFSRDESDTKSMTSRSNRSRGVESARGSLPGVTPRSGRKPGSREKGSKRPLVLPRAEGCRGIKP